jgi:hypothetical protein
VTAVIEGVFVENGIDLPSPSEPPATGLRFRKVNANDFKDTDETFDLVALQSTELHEAVDRINLDPKVLDKLSSELKFIAKGMGVPLPFLPVHGKEEMQLFVRLILTATAVFNAEEMALQCSVAFLTCAWKRGDAVCLFD